MRNFLLLTAAFLAACASTNTQGDHHTSPTESRQTAKPPKRVPPDAIARGPTPAPAVRTPGTTYTPPGAGGPTTGQPGYGGQSTRRNNDPRILPPTRESTIYASSSDEKRPVARGIRPKSATNKEVWEECERLAAQAVTDPATLADELLLRAKRLKDEDWLCAREHALTACYIHLTAEAKDPQGVLRSSAEKDDFREEMARRRERVCRGENDDREALISALLARGRLFDWKDPSDSRNLNESWLPPSARSPAATPEWMKENMRAHEEVRKQAEARKRTITTGRETSRPPSMLGHYMPIPQKAFNACWDAARECLDGFGDEVQRMSDADYECLRWSTVQQCGRNAHGTATWLNTWKEPPARVVKQREQMNQKWGPEWDDKAGFRILEFAADEVKRHCGKDWTERVRFYVNRMQAECTGKFATLFGSTRYLK